MSGFLNKLCIYMCVCAKLQHVFPFDRQYPVLLQLKIISVNSAVNLTRDDKSCQLYRTTSSTSVCRWESWTVSKSSVPEIRRLMYFRRFAHFHESNSNSKNSWADTVITYVKFRKSDYIVSFSQKKNTKILYKSWTPKCNRLTVWQLQKVTATHFDCYTLWWLLSLIRCHR